MYGMHDGVAEAGNPVRPALERRATVRTLAHQRPEFVRAIVFSNTPIRRVDGLGRVGFIAQRLMLALGFSPGIYGRLAAGALIGPEHRGQNPNDVRGLSHRLGRMGRRAIRETIRSVLLEPDDAVDLMATLSVRGLSSPAPTTT